jgi:hypothetical protein
MRADAWCRAIVVATAMMASIACGTYSSNDKIIHNVLATGWNDDGTTVGVAEVIRLRYKRTFAQDYGPAWSPDGSQLYYCPNVDKTAVFITLETGHVRAATMCLGGAVWSPDGRRIAGTRAGMIADELVVR